MTQAKIEEQLKVFSSDNKSEVTIELSDQELKTLEIDATGRTAQYPGLFFQVRYLPNASKAEVTKALAIEIGKSYDLSRSQIMQL